MWIGAAISLRRGFSAMISIGWKAVLSATSVDVFQNAHKSEVPENV
jgi:hypothetical protein